MTDDRLVTYCLCGEKLDGHAQVGGDGPGRPDDGCVSVCVYCAQVSIYDSTTDTGLRPLDPVETAVLCRQNPELARIIATVRLVRLGYEETR